MFGERSVLPDELVEVRGRDVLDVGCGEGWLVRRLASAGARAVGLDPLAIAVERARRKGSSGPVARYVEGVAQALAFPSGSFDVVVFFNSFHHVPVEAMDAALAEAARVLRHRGALYVQEPLASGAFFELTRLVEDETQVRAAAQEALRRAVERQFVELARHDAVTTVGLADFEALRARLVSVEPSRAVAIDELEFVLRAAFERLGRAGEGGYEFDQPVRVKLFGL